MIKMTSSFELTWRLLLILLLLAASSSSSTADNGGSVAAKKTCTGTSSGLSSSPNDYKKLREKFQDCVYVKGNIEISNFNPLITLRRDRRRHSEQDFEEKQLAEMDEQYDFSFLDNIKEVSGYVLVHNTWIKSLKLKSLEIVRGRNLFSNKYSIYIESNDRLERLDMSKLKEIENGAVYIKGNKKLCHMNDVNWLDLVNDDATLNSSKIRENADPKKCPKCTCEPYVTQKSTSLAPGQVQGCWFPGGCQSLTKVICHPDCEGRCFGPGSKQCCNSLCSAGCSGSTNGQCYSCRKFRDAHNGKCVDVCEKLFSLDPKTQQIIKQEEGRYYLNDHFCVKQCPSTYFVYDQYCVKHCPNMTYEFEKEEFDSAKNELVRKRECRSCENERTACQKTCVLRENEIVNKENLKTLQGCEILKGSLIISLDKEGKNDLSENDLQPLRSIRIINGNVRIISDNIRSLSFLGNLEVVRPKEPMGNRFALIVVSKSLKTIGLNKLRSIEGGEVAFRTESLCLADQVNWVAITKLEKNQTINRNPATNCDGYRCDDACNGCWGNGPTSCQFCKTFKIEDRCVERCDKGFQLDEKFLYVSDPVNHMCDYCHPECESGCTGPTNMDCFACANKFLRRNETARECMSTCPRTHYPDLKNLGECLPCNTDCDRCLGPENTISSNGCVSCSSALVKNDASLTIIKCIDQSSYNCTGNMFWDTVKIKHPMRNKRVCRICHDECDGCRDNGNILGAQCDRCKNYHSKATNKCVSECFENEYLNTTTKECLPCHDQCKSGCRGGEVFECTECRMRKLSLQDMRSLFQSKEKGASIATKSSITKAPQLEIVQAYGSYMARRADEKAAEASFCFERCPSAMPFEKSDGSCSAEKAKSLKWYQALIIGFVVLSAGLIIGLAAIISCKRKNSSLKKKPDLYEPSNKKERTLNLLNADKLKKGVILGKGAFGTVFEGYCLLDDDGTSKPKKVRVAIKVLSRDKVADEKVAAQLSIELMNEAQVMASVDHPHCLSLMGLCMAEPMSLVSELMEFGSVSTFLSSHANLAKIEEKTLLVWSKQIAEGMEYLQSLDIVHRDLAARNILLKTLDHVKITDFGLAKMLEAQNEGYRAQQNSMVPIKWLAIESIDDRLFTHESDVWSYGVCIWEIFTFCAKPFSEIDAQDLKASLYNGVRLAQPRLCKVDIYFLMIKCWLENRRARPTFSSLKQSFEKMSAEPHAYLYAISTVDLSKDFRTINEDSKTILDKLNDSADDEDDGDLGEPEEKLLSSAGKVQPRHSVKTQKSDEIELEKLEAYSWDHEENIPKYSSNGNKTFVRKNKAYNTAEPKQTYKPKRLIQMSVSRVKELFNRKITTQISTNSGTRLLSSLSTDSSASSRSHDHPIDLTLNFQSVSGSSSSTSSSSSSSASSTASSAAYEPTGDKMMANKMNYHNSTTATTTTPVLSEKFIENPNYTGRKSDYVGNPDLSRQNSVLTQKFKYSKFNRDSSITNTNSDYLEPIISHANVRQNQEYFGNYGHSLKNQDINEEVNLIGFPETPTQIIMPDHYGPSFLTTENRRNKDVYYNDE